MKKTAFIPSTALICRYLTFLIFCFWIVSASAQKSPVGIVSVQDSVKSVQFGVISSVAPDGGRGVQFSGLSNTTARQFNGLQLSSVSNITNSMNRGLQLAGLLNVTSTMQRGVQIGAFNLGGVDVEDGRLV